MHPVLSEKSMHPVMPKNSLCSVSDIQIVEKREAPLLGSRVTESEDHAIWLWNNEMDENRIYGIV